MSDACGTFTVEGVNWTWDDEALGPMFDDTLGCGSGLYRPSDYGQSGDSWPAPAPGGPYADTLSAFDLTDPNGQWRLYVNDDTDDKTGFVTNRFRLNMATREKAGVAFTEDAVTLAEGGERQLTLRRPASPDLLAGEVKVTSVPMSAASTGDFTPVSTTIQFAAGQTEDGSDRRHRRRRRGARRDLRRHHQRRHRRRRDRQPVDRRGHDPPPHPVQATAAARRDPGQARLRLAAPASGRRSWEAPGATSCAERGDAT